MDLRDRYEAEHVYLLAHDRVYHELNGLLRRVLTHAVTLSWVQERWEAIMVDPGRIEERMDGLSTRLRALLKEIEGDANDTPVN